MTGSLILASLQTSKRTTSIETNLNIDPTSVVSTLTGEVTSLATSLLALGAACGIVAIIITIIRHTVASVDKDATSATLARIARIAGTLSFMAFIASSGMTLAKSMGY